MNEKKKVFEDYHALKSLMIMAVPAIISQLITLIYNIADTWFIGLTNNPSMVAACSLVLPIYMLSVAISNLFGTGGGSLISRLLGDRSEQEAKKVFALSVWMSFITAVAVACSTMLFCDPLLTLLGASNQTREYARQYMMYVVGIGGVFNVMSMVLSNLIRSCGYSKEAGIGISLGGILNIILDPIFMFWVFPDGMQVTGAAFATMISNILTFLYFIIICVNIRKKTVVSMTLRQGFPERKSIYAIFGVGVPAGISVLLFDIANMIANKKMSMHGDAALAAYGIVTKVERLPLNIGIGICLGMIPLIAYNYSAKNTKRMKQIFNCARIVGVTIAVLSIIFYFVCSNAIITFFIDDVETVQLGTSFLRARCFATPFMFLCFNMVHYFNAIGRGKISFGLAVVRQIIFNIPIMLLLNHMYGAYGLVWTQLIADLFTVLVSYIVYFMKKKDTQPCS
ncbi:MAG: MATE family efflux transporter [Wujia sp.]